MLDCLGGGEVALESTMYPGQHVGILPDGSSKAPGSTGTGAHGRFMPMVLSQEAVVVCINVCVFSVRFIL